MPFRLATLTFALAAVCAALAVASPALSAEHPARARSTTIDAEIIEGVSDLEVTARGNAEIRRDDTAIFGDVLRYNRELGRAEGDGGVRLQSGADRFYGPRLQYNTLDDTGVFEQPDLPAAARPGRARRRRAARVPRQGHVTASSARTTPPAGRGRRTGC